MPNRVGSRRAVALGGSHHPSERHYLVVLTVLALPFSYVPHELGLRGVGTTVPLVLMIVATGAKYRVFAGSVSGFEGAALAFTVWIALRVAVFAPLEGVPPDWYFLLRAAGSILAGIILFRLGQRDDLRHAVRTGLAVSLVMLLMMAVYQLSAGLGRLQAIGYTEGFYYFTQDGQFRPFGPFLSPTVFGLYLAMLGAGLCFMHRGAASLVWIGVTIGAVVLTGTRAAWIGLAVAFLLVFLAIPSRARGKALARVMVWAPAIGVLVLGVPGLTSGVLERAAGLFDDGNASTDVRLALWGAVLDIAAQSPMIGFGQQSFEFKLGSAIGDLAKYGHAHQNLLQVLFLYGWAGVAAFISLIVAAYIGIIRTTLLDPTSVFGRAALGSLTVFVVDGFFETTWTSLSVTALLFLVVGTGYSSTARAVGERCQRLRIDLLESAPRVSQGVRLRRSEGGMPA